MGHAIHFLRRLERVSATQLDLALALYRDSALVKYILSRARLPDGAGRVALALEDRREGAHIIVTRGGRFVTCLGRGMSVNGTPVICRGQLDLWMGEVDGLREAVGKLADVGESRRVVFRLLRGGHDVSREDFATVAALHPLLADQFRGLYRKIAEDLQRFRSRYRPGRYRSLSSWARDRLRWYWENSWALGHLAALQGLHVRDWMESVFELTGRLRQLPSPVPRSPLQSPEFTPDHVEREAARLLSWPAARTMAIPVVLRGAWAVARIGRQALASYKWHFQRAQTFTMCLESTLALAALGLRHRRLGAEARKVLARDASPILGPEADVPEHPDRVMARAAVGVVRRVLDDPDGARATHHDLGRALVFRAGETLEPGHPLRFASTEEVPDDLARAYLLHCDGSLLEDIGYLLPLSMALPWLSTANAEDLYLPRAALEAYGTPWKPEDTLPQLDGFHRYYGQLPVVRANKTGRNARCPCGSGTKYKRCCAA